MRKWSFFGAATLIAIAWVGCGGSDSGGEAGGGGSGGAGGSPVVQCNTDPTTCASGTSCWPTDTNGAFGCIAPGHGKKGETCASYVNQSTCEGNLLCWASTDPANGVCVPFCDKDHPCASGEVCTTILFPGGSQAMACIATGTPDGGTTDAPAEATTDAADEATTDAADETTPDAADDGAAADAATE